MRDAPRKYAVYFDPSGERSARVRDVRPRARSAEAANLVDVRTGEARSAPSGLRAELGEHLESLMEANGTAPRTTSASA